MKLHTRKLLAGLGAAAAAMMMVSSSAEALIASSKATGMAATQTSYPMDSFVGVYNPAGIVDVCDRADIDAIWDQTGQSATVFGNQYLTAPNLNPFTNGFYDAGKTKDFYLSNFGINKHLHCMPCDMTVGLVFYNRNFLKTTYGRPNLLLGETPLGFDFVHQTLAPMVAIRVLRDHSIGLSVNINAQRLKFNGLENFDNPLLSTAPGRVTNNGYGWSSGVGFTIGWLSRFWCDRFRIGASYQFRTKCSEVGRYKGFIADHGRTNLPQRAQGGISLDWLPCSTIAFDFEWINWKQVKGISNPLTDLLAQQLAGLTSDGRLGSKTGTGFGFKNQRFYRVGLDYKFGCMDSCGYHLWDRFTLRTGFRHANIPFPSNQNGVNALTCDTCQTFWTVGFTIDRGCFELSYFYARGWQKSYTGKTAIPAVLGGGGSTLRQRKNAMGLGLGYKF